MTQYIIVTDNSGQVIFSTLENSPSARHKAKETMRRCHVTLGKATLCTWGIFPEGYTEHKEDITEIF